MKKYVGHDPRKIIFNKKLLGKYGIKPKKEINLDYGNDGENHIVFWKDIGEYGMGESKFFAIEDLIEMMITYREMLLTLDKRHDHLDIIEEALEWTGEKK